MAPESIICFIFLMAGLFRCWNITPRTILRLRHSATIARAGPTDTAMGFSHSTCTPARAASIVSGGWK